MINEIQPTGGNYRPGQIARVQRANVGSARSDRPEAAGDRVEISDLAYWRAAVAALPEVREEKIAAVRAQLSANKYETAQRWTIAIDQLMEDLGSEL